MFCNTSIGRLALPIGLKTDEIGNFLPLHLLDAHVQEKQGRGVRHCERPCSTEKVRDIGLTYSYSII